MIEILDEAADFNTSQKVADQAKMVFKKSWFSDIEIIKIFGLVSHGEYDEQELLKRDKTQNTENLIFTEPSINTNTK